MEGNHRPLFSVIVPVYKAERYLEQCVESVLKQTHTDFELILVDDGSPDRCPEICDAYAEKDCRVQVIHKPNGGNVSARKAGLEAAKGTYIVHLDSDDYLAEGLFASVAQTIENNDADAVLFGYVQFSEENQTPHPQGVPAGVYRGADMETIRGNLILGSDCSVSIYGSLWSMIIRRELLIPWAKTVPQTLYRGEDLAAVAPAIAACNCVAVLDLCGYFYRTTPGSIMSSLKPDTVDQARQVADYLSEKMGTEYRNRLDCYVLLEAFRFLEDNIQLPLGKYRALARRTVTPEVRERLKRARCGADTHISDKVVFFVMRHQWFAFLWLLKRIRK